jgi:DNA-binding CsgD family transcriptional regulator
VAANVLRTDDRRLAFVHPILRAAIYDALAPGERSELHRRAADLLAADGAELDAIASQLMASEPTGSIAVARRLREAAARALGRGAPEDGVAYLTRALAEGCGRELRAELSFELATAAKLAGRLRLAVEHYEETRRLAEDPALRARAALELALMRAMRGAWDASTALVDAALVELDEGSSELAVHLECLRAGATASDPRLVEGFDRRLPALRELTRAEVPSARSLALLLAGVAGWRGEDVDADALVERGWQGQPLLDGVDGWALGQGLDALVFGERLTDAGRLSEQLLAEARTAGSLSGFLLGSAYGGWIDARRGRLLAAEGALRAALEPALAGRLNFTLSWQLWLAIDVLLERPQAADLAAGTESVELGAMAVLHSGAMLSEARGRVRHAAGRTTEAIADVRRAGEILTALGHVNPNASSWRSALALMLASEERKEALQLVHAELADARRFGHPRALGIALRTLGLLEGGVRGRRRLEEAVQILAGSPARLEHARALVELGAAMRRSGERAAAREPLRLGLDIAAAGGATRLLERVRTELAASGARPRRERASGVEALTPSELRVARLAAEGRTNNEVAQALFVTAKTVDTHLSHAYAKLGISSRRALAAALAQQQQPPER